MCSHEARPLLLPDSSKELEELRSAFTRALEYLQQEVEERECGPDPSFVQLYFCSGLRCLFRQRLLVSKLLSNFD